MRNSPPHSFNLYLTSCPAGLFTVGKLSTQYAHGKERWPCTQSHERFEKDVQLTALLWISLLILGKLLHLFNPHFSVLELCRQTYQWCSLFRHQNWVIQNNTNKKPPPHKSVKELLVKNRPVWHLGLITQWAELTEPGSLLFITFQKKKWL